MNREKKQRREFMKQAMAISLDTVERERERERERAVIQKMKEA